MTSTNPLLKKLWLHRYGLGASCLIICAVILRVILVSLGWTTTESDESMNNLAALHIEKLGEHPLFFYGQNYLGAFEAYAGSVVYRIFGPSVEVMRLEMIALTALFLVCMYFITKKLYTKKFALVILIFFLLGSQWTIRNQFEAEGYPEVPLFAAALFLTACTVALSYHRLRSWQRCLLYALWGLLAGLALWIQLLIVPYLLLSGLLILILCWKEFFTKALWCILPTLLIGAAPLIYYNLHAAPGTDSLTTFLALSKMGYNPLLGLSYHLKMVFFFTLPIANGLTPVCSIQGGEALSAALPHTSRCLLIDGTWSLSYLFLMLVGLILAVMALRKAYKLDVSPERHQQIAQHLARLLLIVGVCASLLSLIQGNAVNIDPTSSWRYLICTWVSLPAVLWPLWTCEQWLKVSWLQRIVPALKLCVLFLVLLILVDSTVFIFLQGVPAAQADRQQLATLEHTLEQQHITRFYTDYWTCGRIIFDTQEHLICGSTDEGNNQITHGYDRYFPYRLIVEQAPVPSFVYADGAQQIATLNQFLARSHVSYQLIKVPGYVIYKMAGKIPSLAVYSLG